MAAVPPTNSLTLFAASAAEELGFVALADVASALGALGQRGCRLIGGHMVGIHCRRWQVAEDLARETLDADVDIGPPLVMALPVVAEQLARLGYTRAAGATFARDLPDFGPGMRAEIDLLVPAVRTRARARKRVADFETTEVSGLAEAQKRDGITVDLTMKTRAGRYLRAHIVIPDEADALVLKALAWQARRADKDAIDVWRCLEVASAARVDPERFTRGDGKVARDVLLNAFDGLGSEGVSAIEAYRRLSAEEAVRIATRLSALRLRVCGR